MRATTARKLLLWLLGGTTVLLLASGEPRQAFAVAAVGGTIALLFLGAWWVRDRPRADAYRDEARRLRLEYSFEDPHDLLSLPHPLLHRVVHMRGLEHVTWGTWNGVDVEVFEYWYAVGSDPSRNDYRRFTCVLTPVPASWPDIVIDPERTITAIPQAVGLPDVEFEHEAFNRAYLVRCDDRRFASALVDARMMAWLMDEVAGFGFELVGGRMLAFTERVDPWRIESVMAGASGFLGHVPDTVRSWYPDEA